MTIARLLVAGVLLAGATLFDSTCWAGKRRRRATPPATAPSATGSGEQSARPAASSKPHGKGEGSSTGGATADSEKGKGQPERKGEAGSSGGGGGGAATTPAAIAPAPAGTAGVARGEGAAGRDTIEFDERVVRGGLASGAIYLFQRGVSDFRSMIEAPPSFRDRTVKKLYPPRDK
ncbi:MAG: hypothetical protein V2A73_18815 [Pseudomonadota bacterium]